MQKLYRSTAILVTTDYLQLLPFGMFNLFAQVAFLVELYTFRTKDGIIFL